MFLNGLTAPLFILVQTSIFSQVAESLQCYACPIQRTMDGCSHTSTCDPGKICMLRRNVDNSTDTVRYQTLCKERNECLADINKYQIIVGSLIGKRDMHQVVSDKGECLLQCCDTEKCNTGCLSGPSTVATTTHSSPHFNIPTPPAHHNTHPPSTTKIFHIPTAPTQTTTMATPSTTTSPSTTLTTTILTTTPTTKPPTTTPSPTTTTTATTTLTTTQKPIVCADGSYLFDNGCYIIPRQEMSFRDAVTFCKSHNSRLVHVDSTQENEFLKDIMKRKREPIQYWIGITDEVKENEWLYYDDNSPASFFDWMPGEPDGKQNFDGIIDANCAVFDPFAGFQWRDEECSPYQYSIPICEKRVNPASVSTQVIPQTQNLQTTVSSVMSSSTIKDTSTIPLTSTTKVSSSQSSNSTIISSPASRSQGFSSSPSVLNDTRSSTVTSIPASSIFSNVTTKDFPSHTNPFNSPSVVNSTSASSSSSPPSSTYSNSSILPNVSKASATTLVAFSSSKYVSTSDSTSTNAPITSTTTMPSTTVRVCPSGAYRFQASCYLFVKREMSFRDAREFCRKHNAYLVHVDSAQENDYLKQKMREIHSPVQYWIGIMDEVVENVWTYYDNGLNATYFDWSPGEPDGSHDFDGSNQSDCAVFDPFQDFKWKDEECSPYHYSQTICEL